MQDFAESRSKTCEFPLCFCFPFLKCCRQVKQCLFGRLPASGHFWVLVSRSGALICLPYIVLQVPAIPMSSGSWCIELRQENGVPAVVGLQKEQAFWHWQWVSEMLIFIQKWPQSLADHLVQSDHSRFACRVPSCSLGGGGWDLSLLDLASEGRLRPPL